MLIHKTSYNPHKSQATIIGTISQKTPYNLHKLQTTILGTTTTRIICRYKGKSAEMASHLEPGKTINVYGLTSDRQCKKRTLSNNRTITIDYINRTEVIGWKLLTRKAIEEIGQHLSKTLNIPMEKVKNTIDWIEWTKNYQI